MLGCALSCSVFIGHKEFYPVSKKIALLACVSTSACFYNPSLSQESGASTGANPGTDTLAGSTTETPSPTTTVSSTSTTGASTSTATNTSTTSSSTGAIDSTTLSGSSSVGSADVSTQEMPSEATCGDGDLDVDEECDDGNLTDLDACSNTCLVSICGDGITQLPEECDDGNQAITDTCWPNCNNSQCGTCQFPRPNVMFILDYSTSMNTIWDGNGTRHAGLIAGIIGTLNDYELSQRINVAFMRYGHDPDPNNPGTIIPKDSSGITDGQKLDLSWTSNGAYLKCQHENLATLLTTLPHPNDGALVGIGTWTKGALDQALAIIQAQRAQFGENKGSQPEYRIILITDGEWTNQIGTQKLGPVEQNPEITAQILNTTHNVKTHVMALGEAADKSFANALAAAGGTIKAVQTVSAPNFALQLASLFSELDIEGVIPNKCSD